MAASEPAMLNIWALFILGTFLLLHPVEGLALMLDKQDDSSAVVKNYPISKG